MSDFFPSLLMIRVESLAGPVPVEALVRATSEVTCAATEIARAFAPEWEPLDRDAPQFKGWRVSDTQIETPDDLERRALPESRQRHAIALVLTPPADARGVPHRLRAGVRAIAEKCEERPDGFSDAALRSLRRAALLGRKVRVTLSAGQGEGQALALDESFARHINGWLAGQRAAIGTVEGKLELISVHDRLRFTIYGRNGLRIECLFPETMLAQVKGALGERVCLRGKVRYRKDGKPATVEARTLKTLPANGRITDWDGRLEKLNR